MGEGVPSKSLVPFSDFFLLCQNCFWRKVYYHCAVLYHHNTNPHTEHAPRTRPAAVAHLWPATNARLSSL